MAISEYGASIWCDPYRWIPEAARLLRPGGELVFLVNSVLIMLCFPGDVEAPAGERLLRPQFGMHRFEWPDDDSVEFHLSHGDMIAPAARVRVRDRGADRGQAAADATSDYDFPLRPSTGAGTGPARRSGGRAAPDGAPDAARPYFWALITLLKSALQPLIFFA